MSCLSLTNPRCLRATMVAVSYLRLCLDGIVWLSKATHVGDLDALLAVGCSLRMSRLYLPLPRPGARHQLNCLIAPRPAVHTCEVFWGSFARIFEQVWNISIIPCVWCVWICNIVDICCAVFCRKFLWKNAAPQCLKHKAPVYQNYKVPWVWLQYRIMQGRFLHVLHVSLATERALDGVPAWSRGHWACAFWVRWRVEI